MTVVALTNFITVTDGAGRPKFHFQNSKPNNTIRYKGVEYPYLGFIYQGAAKNRTGDNLESALVLSANAISMGYAVRAARSRWNVRVDSCSMHPVNFTVGKTLTTEFWIAASVSYDMQTVEILLSSSIDAVGASAPTRVLTRAMVGALPTTSSIANR